MYVDSNIEEAYEEGRRDANVVWMDDRTNVGEPGRWMIISLKSRETRFTKPRF